MKHFTKYVAACAMLCMMACSEKDDLNGGVIGNEPSQGDTYATMTLALPTRSITMPDGNEYNNAGGESVDGYEIGQDWENSVKTVIVVLANKTEDGKYEYITNSISDSEKMSDENTHDGKNHITALPTYKLVFETQRLVEFAGKKVYLFAYANPTREITDFFKNLEATEKAKEESAAKNTEWIDKVYAAANPEEIWTPKSFLMTNKFIQESNQIPTLEVLQTTHNVVSNPFDLGAIDVQRASARFDFKQKGTLKDADGKTILNKYQILNRINNSIMGAVEIDGMAMVNQANQFYYLPRVSNNGQLNGEGYAVCGPEKSTNYVISPYAAEIATLTEDGLAGFASKYKTGNFLPNITNYADLTYTSITELTKQDNDDNWTDNDADGNDKEGFDKTNYYIWQYTTENTIPVVDKQVKGITTGIVFKAHLLPVAQFNESNGQNEEANQKMLDYMKKGGDIYLYAGVLYAGANAIVEAIAEAPNSQLAYAFADAFTAVKDDEGNVTSYTYDNAKGKEAGFTVYTAEKDKEGKLVNTVKVGEDEIGRYDIYYRYYNRHNDNGNPSIMAPMEFGVVRNNVYKISVEVIYNFGVPGNDPDDPWNPDEDPETYFSVRLHVLPWVVRVNNIEF